MNDFALFLLRIVAGSFMLFGHGLPKIKRLFSSTEITFFDPFGIGPGASLVLVTFAEFFCSILLIFGLFTRASLIPLIITMFVAAFIRHGGDTFSQMEKALLFLLIFFVLFLAGPGKIALDNYFKSRTRNKIFKYLIK